MKKYISLLMSTIIVLSSVVPIILNISEVMAADYSVKYNGAVTYRTIKSTEIFL